MRQALSIITLTTTLAVCLMALGAGAQESIGGAQHPSLEQAQAVIAEEMRAGGADILSDHGSRTSLTSFKGCRMRYRKHSATGGLTDYALNLADLDAGRVSLDRRGRFVSFRVTGRAEKIELSTVPGISAATASAGVEAGGGYRGAVFADSLRVRSRESGIRLQDALVRAIKACQSQP